jgi:hypothetical protein
MASIRVVNVRWLVGMWGPPGSERVEMTFKLTAI